MFLPMRWRLRTPDDMFTTRVHELEDRPVLGRWYTVMAAVIVPRPSVHKRFMPCVAHDQLSTALDVVVSYCQGQLRIQHTGTLFDNPGLTSISMSIIGCKDD
jgi:hypothetical protein